MKKSTSWCMVLFTVFLSGFFDLVHSGSFWDEYLRIPDEKAVAAFEKTVAEAPKPCSPGTLPSNEQRVMLFELISMGNWSAFRAGLAISKCYHASYSEDFCQSAGAFFERKPLEFLRTVREKDIQDKQLKRLLVTLPLDLVADRDDVRISLLNKRIALLNSIDDPSVAEVKEKGLHFLKEYRKFLEKTESDEKK